MHYTLSLLTTALVGFTSVLAAPAPILTGCPLTGVKPNNAWFIDTTNSSNVIAAPAANQKLAKLVLGVGSQNYSCVAGKPTANGAVAVLYDLSCASTVSEDWADVVTRAGLQAPANAQSQGVRILQTMMNAQLTVGYHFFKGDFATPAFEFLDKKKFYGGVAGKVPAMAGADSGRKPLAFGAVPTLRLNSKAGMGSDFSSIFRVQTAGGVAPATCDWTGQKQIPYAAQYWVYI